MLIVKFEKTEWNNHNFLFCSPGDEISFALHDKMKIQHLTYVFTKEEEKKRFDYKTSESGFGGPLLHKYMVFEIKYEDLKKIANTKNIVASIKCKGFKTIENIIPERTRRTMADFIEKIKK